MSEQHDAIRVQFETLHQSYIAELPRKILGAREIWDLVADGGWDLVIYSDGLVDM